jgi:cephalosporin hydroxylase
VSVSKVNAGSALHAAVSLKANTTKQAPAARVGFDQWYGAYGQGRGIWKWSNALTAYERHFNVYAGHPVALCEIGIQSGGSIAMWETALAPQCHVYGVDINPATQQFATATTTITIGDQADVNMWNSFFTSTVANLDILVDDGGHESHQMLVTLQSAFPHMTPGGMIAIEDIHGQDYIQSFFTPAAHFLGQQAAAGLLDSVHVYPYLLVAQVAGQRPDVPKSTLTFAGVGTRVDSFEALWAAAPANAGGHIILENAGWGPFLTPAGLTNFFSHFASLHDYGMHDIPAGCATTSAPVCTNQITSSQMQATVTGVHVYANNLVVEIAAPGAVNIQAVRKGNQWLDYR